MSLQNGDKARDNRERKRNIQRRKRTRALYEAAGVKTGQPVTSQHAGSTPAKKKEQV